MYFQIAILLFDYFVVEAACKFDRLEAYSVETTGSRTLIGTFCGLYKELKIKSTTNKMYIVFSTDDSDNFKGFRGHLIEPNNTGVSLSKNT